MPDTAQDIINDVGAKLNDPSLSIYTSIVQLPFTAIAGRKLESLLELNGIPVLKQRSTVIPLPVGDTVLPTYPTDFVQPINLWERPAGSTDGFSEMEQRDWEPDVLPDLYLRVWAWRDNKVQFIGSTQDKDIRLDYYRTLNPLVDVTANVEVAGSRNYLSALTAQMVARDVMNSPSKAAELYMEVKEEEEKLITKLTKRLQGLGVRRRAYRGYGRRVIK